MKALIKIIVSLVLLGLFGGLALAADSDADGIDDSVDVCPNTPFLEVNDVATSGANIGCTVTPEREAEASPFVANDANNVNVGQLQGEGSHVRNNDALQDIGNNDEFFQTSQGGDRGINNTLIRIARDLKNLFFIIASLYFLIIIMRLLFAQNTEEEAAKFRKGILWITIGIIVMQMAYTFVKLLFDRDVGETLAANLIEKLLNPIFLFLETSASFFFIGGAIFAFYRIISANGDEEKSKGGRMSILYAIIGFIIVKVSRLLVESIYGRLECRNLAGGFIEVTNSKCLTDAAPEGAIGILMVIINWMNSFVGIAIVIMIMYAGANVLLSAGDEEKLKKAKSALIYIAIGIGILSINYLLLTFFIIPESTI